jgi:hypothetical protein
MRDLALSVVPTSELLKQRDLMVAELERRGVVAPAQQSASPPNTGIPKSAPENMEADELARQHNRCKCGGELVVAEWQCIECNTFIGNP